MSNAGGMANLRRQWSVRSENRSIIPATQRQISLQASGIVFDLAYYYEGLT